MAPDTTRNILAADIGGTNSRFAHFRLSGGGEPILCETTWLPTNGVDSFAGLLGLLAASGFGLSPAEADAAVLAVPGAVVGRTVHFANVRWTLDLDELPTLLGTARAACINDFTAQALGCRRLGATAEAIRPGDMDPDRIQAVIGAGTGLGHAALLPLPGGGCQVLPSEAGQTPVSFIGSQEHAFAEFVCRATGENYPRGDSVLTGSGLVLLHRFLTGEERTPAEVGATLTADSPTTGLFARFYGRAARDYALTVLSVGGLYVCGGVAAKNPLLVRHPEFSREFLDSPTYGRLLAQIPVRLVRDEQTGLFGAAEFARTLLDTLP